MKPFSITAPEEIAKEYGGDKRKIQQAAAQGLVDPTSAVLAGMFIDRIRSAAAAEQAPQATVAEQVMNPQPQMPSAGLAAAPQAAQMQQPMPPRMGQPSAPQMPQPAQPQMAQAPQTPPQQPQGMAMGGGLDAIPYYEGRYAPGGLVSFADGGNPQDQMMAQSRALIEALQRSRDPAERRTIQDRLRQLTSAMSVAPPGLVTEPLGPQAGDDRAGLANMDMLRQMEADATARANYAAANPVDFGAGMETFAGGVVPRRFTDSDSSALDTGMETFAEGVVPRGFTSGQSGQSDVLDQGMETFADTQRSVNPYGPEGRIDPNRFNTGTLTEAEARRIEGGSESGLGILDRIANFRGFDNEGMTAREKLTNPMRYIREDLFGEGPTPDAYTGATMPASVRRITDPEEIARLKENTRGPAADTEAMVGDGAMRDMGRSPFGLEQQFDRQQQTTTVTDQIAAEQEATRETQPAVTEGDEETEMSLSDEFTAFQDQMKDIMPKNEYGEYRKKFEQMMKDTKGTMERGRKDAFSMALLQAGLGMLGQQGGQTALQALGKAALPATKQYMDTIKDLKKEDQELLKLGLSLEKMDTEERNATFRTMANLFGQERGRAAQLKAAEIQRGVDNRLLDKLGTEGYTQFKIDQAKAGSLATAGTKGLTEFNADVQNRNKAIADVVGKVTETQARIAGKSVAELRDELRTSMEQNWPAPKREDYGLSPAQAGGGAAAPMEAQDKNGRPIVSYDGGQNWVYK